MNLPSNDQHVDEDNIWPLQWEIEGQQMTIDWETALASFDGISSSQRSLWATSSDLRQDDAENFQQTDGGMATAAVAAINPNGPLPGAQFSETSKELPQPYYYRCPLCDMAFRRLEHQTRHTRTVHLSKRPEVKDQVPLQTAESFTFPSQDTSSTTGTQFSIDSSSTSLFSDPTMPPPPQPNLFDGIENFEALAYSNYFTSADLGHYSNYSPIASPRGSPTSASGVLSDRQVSPVSYGSGISGESYPPGSGKKGKKPVSISYNKIVKKAPKPHKHEIERRVGRRRGPRTLDQRKQAHEIIKLRACLRCRFLGITCNKNTPCQACQSQGRRSRPVVPCTRLQVKDLDYFLKDWKVDYGQQADPSLSISNIQGFSLNETVMWATHGYGLAFPVTVREVFMRSDLGFSESQTPSTEHGQESMQPKTSYDKLAVGCDGVSDGAVQGYIEKHIDSSFQTFIDGAFTSVPFVTEVLQTMHEFQSANGSPIVRKALKLVLTYSLTAIPTLIHEKGFAGWAVQDAEEDNPPRPRFFAAGPMVDENIRCCLVGIWRELHKDVLGELSRLHEGVYAGEGSYQNWFMIFILSLALLITWERMQYDCHCRALDPALAVKFCEDMEAVPFGVVKGLFHTMSRDFPEIKVWSDEPLDLPEMDVCGSIAMKQMQRHVLKYESYLLTRKDTKFDRDDPHCLSNKLLSQLVLRDGWGSHAEAGAPA